MRKRIEQLSDRVNPVDWLIEAVELANVRTEDAERRAAVAQNYSRTLEARLALIQS